MKRTITLLIIAIITTTYSLGSSWKTMFAYNHVTQIAIAEDKVYALSDGALFSVNIKSEEIQLYNSENGLHGTQIASIYYDNEDKTLIIAYKNGKIDLLTSKGVKYIGDLYTKDITYDKVIHNVTMHNGLAYLASDFGIITLDLNKQELVDTYYVGDSAKATKINDIIFNNDSIFAIGDTIVYSARLTDNIIDYTYWHSEPTGRIVSDPTKGKYLKDQYGNTWMASGIVGLGRNTVTGEHVTYKPQGPLNNAPYRLYCSNGTLYMLNGGRWATENRTAGNVMIYRNGAWTNISQADIVNKVGSPVRDFMNVAEDPNDPQHFFVTSYGTGLYEFHNGEVVMRYMQENSTIHPAAPIDPVQYTRTDGACYDKDGNLLVLDTETDESPIVVLKSNGEWDSIKLEENGVPFILYTPQCLTIDNGNPNWKWLPQCRKNQGLALLNDQGTLDSSDDILKFRNEWHDQNGATIRFESLYSFKQDNKGNLWMGTNIGLIEIPVVVNYFNSDSCFRPDGIDENGENPMQTQSINAIEQDEQGNLWIGTNIGLYVLSEDGNTLIKHYTSENSVMPSSSVISLAYDATSQIMYIGTSDGLVAYYENESTDTQTGSYTGDDVDYGIMGQWRMHYSYRSTSEMSANDQEIYAVSDGTLYVINMSNYTMQTWNKSNGLNGTIIKHIAYDNQNNLLVIAYTDGKIDLLCKNGDIIGMTDLFQKASSTSVTVNNIYVGSKYTYLAMPFGIIVLNTKKAEIADTYYIGAEASNANILNVVELNDTLYALSDSIIYYAPTRANLVDYAQWSQLALPVNKNNTAQNICSAYGKLYLLQQDSIFSYNNVWKKINNDSYRWISSHDGKLYSTNKNSYTMEIDSIGTQDTITLNYSGAIDVIDKNGYYWLGTTSYGVIRIDKDQNKIYFIPDGPQSNSGSRMKVYGDQVYVASGERWAVEGGRLAHVSIYNGKKWIDIPSWDIDNTLGVNVKDIVSIAADSKDLSHFYAATYGYGVIEYQNYKPAIQYTIGNSTLKSAAGEYLNYVRTEGAMIDDFGYLWVLNTENINYPINILHDGQWTGIPLKYNGTQRQLYTPQEILVDNRDSHRKWIIDQRGEPRVILLDDNGTPAYAGDDRCMIRNEFIDQDEIHLTPSSVLEYIYCLAQDKKGNIWIGTAKGIVVIPYSTDFLTSNRCTRVKIPRNDGTNLADYLLGTEQVTAIAVDGANRKWIGTSSSGLYLMSSDGLTTIAHFTTDNSPIPSNDIQSIAIIPTTGEVFVGTGNGIASYRSDASESHEDFSSAYAFPNPVRPNYVGTISIVGLMDNTAVNIIDEAGNVVCKTQSNGGTAVWDGCDQHGKRVGSGVYTALCNATEGGHTTVKILVMH